MPEMQREFGSKGSTQGTAGSPEFLGILQVEVKGHELETKGPQKQEASASAKEADCESLPDCAECTARSQEAETSNSIRPGGRKPPHVEARMRRDWTPEMEAELEAMEAEERKAWDKVVGECYEILISAPEGSPELAAYDLCLRKALTLCNPLEMRRRKARQESRGRRQFDAVLDEFLLTKKDTPEYEKAPKKAAAIPCRKQAQEAAVRLAGKMAADKKRLLALDKKFQAAKTEKARRAIWSQMSGILFTTLY
jgi:hypothetical protein